MAEGVQRVDKRCLRCVRCGAPHTPTPLTGSVLLSSRQPQKREKLKGGIETPRPRGRSKDRDLTDIEHAPRLGSKLTHLLSVRKSPGRRLRAP